MVISSIIILCSQAAACRYGQPLLMLVLGPSRMIFGGVRVAVPRLGHVWSVATDIESISALIPNRHEQLPEVLIVK